MAIDLTKRAATAQVSLIKMLQKEADKGNDLGDLTAQIYLVMDYSISMDTRYHRGEVQELAERALGLAMSGLDDDGIVPVCFFDDKAYDIVEATAKNYSGFVEDWRHYRIGGAASKLFGRFKSASVGVREFGGTDYLPAIQSVLAHMKKTGALEPGKPPVLVLFVTDGATRNESAIINALVDAANLPVFWQFFGLGYSPAFLSRLNTMGGRVVDNVGLFDVNNSQAISDEEFYDSTISEFFPEWLPAARKAGIVKDTVTV